MAAPTGPTGRDVIETHRLLLRPVSQGDLDDLAELYGDPEVTRFVSRLDRSQTQDHLRRAERSWQERGHGTFAVLDGASGRFVGRVSLRYWGQFDETEVGWVLRRDAWNHGYATEAGHACLDWAFTHLAIPYLTAMVHPDNVRSSRVAERLGMQPLRMDVLLGEPVRVYAITREEWASRRTPTDGGGHHARRRQGGQPSGLR